MQYVEVLLPTIVIAIIFFFVIRALFNADRKEREAQAAIFEEHGVTPGPGVRRETSTEESSEGNSANSADKSNNE